MTRIDSHQHFWRYDASDYAWITNELQAIRRDFVPDDLKPELKALQFQGCVAVQARQSLAENRALLAFAQDAPFIRGVVGWVDLCSENVVDELAEFARHDKFVGVRHVVQDEPDDDFMRRDDFMRGIAKLRRFGLTYDILVFERQLPAALALVEAFPEQPFVLDHCAKPLIRAGELDPWRERISELARHPNVSCKVSGLVTEADWQDWKPDDLRPYLDVVFEAFGENRLLYGSDWPVCKLAGEYANQYDVVADYAASQSDRAQAKLFGDNARRFYGLK